MVSGSAHLVNNHWETQYFNAQIDPISGDGHAFFTRENNHIYQPHGYDEIFVFSVWDVIREISNNHM